MMVDMRDNDRTGDDMDAMIIDGVEIDADTLARMMSDEPTTPARKDTSYLDGAMQKLRDQRPGYTPKARVASPGQIRFVAVLLKNAGKVNPDVARIAKDWWLSKATEAEGDWVYATSLNFDQVSATINRLKAIAEGPVVAMVTPVTAAPMSAFQELLKGLWTEDVKPHPGRGVTLCRFALRYDDAAEGANTVRFFKLKESKAGKRYLVRQLGSDTEMLKLENGAMAVAERLAADVKGAVQLYGQELGYCGDCGHELTNDESRAIGIGPYCRNKEIWTS